MRSLLPPALLVWRCCLLLAAALASPAANAQAVKSNATVATPPILRAAQPRSGIYFSFEQFAANRPDTTARIRLDSVRGNTLRAQMLGQYSNTNGLGWEGTLLLRAKIRRADGSAVPTEQVWGFAHAGQLFVRQGNLYRLLTRLQNFYTYVGAAPVDYEATRRRGLALANLGYGSGSPAPGGKAGRPITGALPNSRDDDTGQPMVFAINMQTGYTAPYPPPGYLPHSDTAFVYVYRLANGSAEAQRIFLNDELIGNLQPGQYMEIVWPHFGNAMRLSADTPGGPTLMAVLNTATANYVKLQNGAALLPWQWMPATQGEAEVDALEKQRR